MPDLGGAYICAGVQDVANQPLERNERYYMLFNSGAGAVMINAADDRNRWLLQFRGEKFYYYFLKQISDHMSSFHVNSIPVPMIDVVDRLRNAQIFSRIETERGSWGEPFVLSSIPPELNYFTVDQTKLRDYRLNGWNPLEDFGNRHFRDRNSDNTDATDQNGHFTDQ
jgi:hypothetical protein